VLAVSLASFLAIGHGGEDWREAVATARRCIATGSMPVLVRTGVVEAQNLAWLSDEKRREYILAPLSYYPLDCRVIPLPWRLEGASTFDYMERVVSTEVGAAERFLVIARRYGDDGNFVAWIRGRVGRLGFVARELGGFGGVEVVIFEKTPGSCGAV